MEKIDFKFITHLTLFIIVPFIVFTFFCIQKEKQIAEYMNEQSQLQSTTCYYSKATNTFYVKALLLLFFSVIIYYLINKNAKLSSTKTDALQKINKKMQSYISIIDRHVLASSTDLDGVITDASDAFCKMSGYAKEQLIGQNHSILRHPKTDKILYEQMWDTLAEDKIWKGELKNIKADGTTYWVEATIFPNYDDEGIKIGYTSIRHDITDKKRAQELAITDPLTNLYNRRYFNEVFTRVLNEAKRKDEHICFMMLDIDNFKSYNDNYGHQMGDEALQKVASQLKLCAQRASDYVFRLGGEEFGVLFYADNKDKAYDFAQKIRNDIESLQILHEYNAEFTYLTVSTGVFCINARDTDAVKLYKDVDDLLYLAKKSGRNSVVINN